MPRARGRDLAETFGFFFIVPDIVFQRFEQILGEVSKREAYSKETISVLTYRLGEVNAPGFHRPLVRVRTVHYALEDIARALITYVEPTAAPTMEHNILTILDSKFSPVRLYSGKSETRDIHHI